MNIEHIRRSVRTKQPRSSACCSVGTIESFALTKAKEDVPVIIAKYLNFTHERLTMQVRPAFHIPLHFHDALT